MRCCHGLPPPFHGSWSRSCRVPRLLGSAPPQNLSRFAGEVETRSVEGEGDRVGTQQTAVRLPCTSASGRGSAGRLTVILLVHQTARNIRRPQSRRLISMPREAPSNYPKVLLAMDDAAPTLHYVQSLDHSCVADRISARIFAIAGAAQRLAALSHRLSLGPR